MGRDPRAQRGSPPRLGPPADLTSSLAQLPAPSLVLCLQPPLPVCRDTCQRPPAPGTHRTPGPRPHGPAAGAAKPRGSTRPLPLPPGPARGGIAGGSRTPDHPRLQHHRYSPAYSPRHDHPRAPPRRDSTLQAIPSPPSPVSRPSDGNGRNTVPAAGMLCVGQVRCGHPCPALVGPRGSGAVPARRGAPAPPVRAASWAVPARHACAATLGQGAGGGSARRGAGGTSPVREGAPRAPEPPLGRTQISCLCYPAIFCREKAHPAQANL